jgi:hypothetical protein
MGDFLFLKKVHIGEPITVITAFETMLMRVNRRIIEGNFKCLGHPLLVDTTDYEVPLRSTMKF